MKELFCSFEDSKALLEAELVEMIPIRPHGVYYAENGTGPWLVTDKRIEGPCSMLNLSTMASIESAEGRRNLICPAVSYAEVANLVGIIHNSGEVEIDWFFDYNDAVLHEWVKTCLLSAQLIKDYIAKRKTRRYASIGKKLEEYMKSIEGVEFHHDVALGMKETLDKILKES